MLLVLIGAKLLSLYCYHDLSIANSSMTFN
jgi:hypothetical protein